MWAALFGAVVGGSLTFMASIYMEGRRDRRRQIGKARLAADELRRAAVEFAVLLEDAEDQWFEGPHAAISATVWFDHAAEFVGVLTEMQFREVDAIAADVRSAGDFGFTTRVGTDLSKQLDPAIDLLSSVGRVGRIDRVVWRI